MWKHLVLVSCLASCGSSDAASTNEPVVEHTATIEPTIEASAEPPTIEAPAESTAPVASSIPSARLVGGELDLRHVASADELELLRGAHHTTPRALAAARLTAASESITWIVYVDSDSLERWALARANGTYEAERARIEALVRACQETLGSCFECPDCDAEDDELRPAGLHVRLARLSSSASGPTLDGTALDGTSALGEGEMGAVFREVRDLDGDGRVELSLSLSESADTGQSGAGSTLFRWIDGDSLHVQLDITHRSWAYGCSGELSERSGFSMHDRNGDGHDDVGVRHAVWAAGCDDDGWNATTGTHLDDAELVRTLALDANAGMRISNGVPVTEGEDGFDEADHVNCPYFDERLRYLYDVTSDTWVLGT